MKKMHASALVILLFLGTFLFAPEISTNTKHTERISQITSEPNEYDTSAINVADDSLNVFKRNWDFEEEDALGGPADWYYSGSTWSRSNDTYQDFVANDSYSGRIQAQGSEYSDSYSYLTQYPGSLSANIDETLELEFWWYTVSIPDISAGGSCFFTVQFYNGTNYYLNYYLAAGNSFGSNSSTTTRFLLNESILQWNHFKQNLLDDFNSRPGWIASSNLYITQLQFQIYSQQNVIGITEAVIDDVSLTNSTAYDYLQARNGNFETGSGDYWSWSGQSDPGLISLTTDSVHGSKALNLTASCQVDWSYSNIYIEHEFGNPLGITPYTSNILILDFDWQYSDTYNGEGQSAYVSVYFSNDTYWSSVNFYFGNNMNSSLWSNSTQPTYSYYYTEAPGFGSRGEWNHFNLDIYDIVTELGLLNMGVYNVQFYADTNGYSNATAELLIDSLRILSYPTGNAGFEMENDGRSPSYPVSGWNNFGTLSYFNHSRDSRSGSWAANITPAAGDSGRLSRDMRYQVDSSSYLDFWWRLDDLTTSVSGYAYLELRFEGSYYLRYYLALDSDLSISNSTFNVRYLLPQVNTTSTWIHTVRNLELDLEAGFGTKIWNMSVINLNAFSDGSGRTSILFDDVTITDGTSPTGVPLAVSSVYYRPTLVEINADDNRAGVKEVVLYYNSGSGWNQVTATDEFTHYEASIPILPWNTTVDYFATITDYAGHLTVSDNGGSDYTLIVGDDVDPLVTLNTPSDASIIVDTTIINASASDVGSGIENVEFIVDSTSIYNDTSAPYSLSWDSRTISNGTHTLKVIAYDKQGRMSEDTILVDVQNDVGAPLAYSLMLNPTQPNYGEPATVSLALLDSTGIKNATLFYAVEAYAQPGSIALSQDWSSVLMDTDGPVYAGVIPAQDYWNTILYYVVAFDVYDQAIYIGTEANPLEYNVGDSNNPSLSISGPVDGASVEGIIEFSVSAVDTGSGINQIRFYVDGSLVTSGDSNLNAISWDTTLIENGDRVVVFEAEDYEGNVFHIEMTYEVANPDVIGAFGNSVSSFMSSYGVFVGAAAVILGYGFFKVLMNRRAAGGKPKARKKK